MPDHTHDHDEPCSFHGPLVSNMEAFVLVSDLTDRLGRPDSVDLDARMVLWSDEREPWTVEVALGHGRPVVEVIGESREADMASGVCARLGVSCLDGDGNVIAGPLPAVDPWAGNRGDEGEGDDRMGGAGGRVGLSVVEGGGGGKPN